MLTFIGMKVGQNWTKWKDSLHYVDYGVVALVIVGVAFLVLRALRRRRGAIA
jgi:membrane protein DedA with SNARE-associated domain